MPNPHFYDTDSGYIHYVSEAIPRLECRVYDAVRTFDDALIAPEEAVQFIPNLTPNSSPQNIRRHMPALFREAVTISNRGVAFMDGIMRGSPLRDNDAWLNNPNGRALFMSQRKDRLRAWRAWAR